MGKLSVFIIGLMLSSMAWAGSPFLEISPTNTFRSSERAMVEAAITQAEALGKPVLLEVAAAWCGPCAALDQALEERKDEMAPVFANFVQVKVEEMHFETMAGADFMAFDVAWFPSFMIYNPTTQKWTALGATTANEIKRVLTDYTANSTQGLGEFYAGQLLADLRASKTVSIQNLIDTFTALSTEASAQRYLDIWGEVTRAMDASPTLFPAPADQIRSYVTIIHSRLLQRGLSTIADFRAIDAKAFAGYETDVRSIQLYEFDTVIGALIRNQGNKAASDQCQALSAKTAALVSIGTADEQRYLQLVRELQCMFLEVQLGTKTSADARTYLATLNEREKSAMTEELMKLFASTGADYDLAVEYGLIHQERYLKAFKSKPVLLARIQKATDDRLNAYRANKSHP